MSALHKSVYWQFEQKLSEFTWPALREQCGLLFWDLKLKCFWLYDVPNTHNNPKQHYQMKKSDADSVIANAHGVLVALFHTHIEYNNKLPSTHDYVELRRIRNTAYKSCYGIVFHSRTRTVTVYNHKGVVSSYVAETVA